MESRVKVAGHPLHQMLLVFPLGLLATAVVFDVIFLVTDNAAWTQAAFYMIGAGVITGVLAAVPGALDWWAIPRGTRAKRVGLIHGVGNVVVVTLFAVSWLLRRDNPTLPPTEAVVAGLVGAGIAVVTGMLGSTLLTVTFVPSIFVLLQRFEEWRQRRKARDKKSRNKAGGPDIAHAEPPGLG